jgi:hypothetical protein
MENLALICSLLLEKQTATIIEITPKKKRFMDKIILDNKKWIQVLKNNRSFRDIREN